MQSSPESEGDAVAVEEEQPQVAESAQAEPPDPALAAMEDRLKRALADLDNYRKRSAREVDRRVGESREAMLRDWLEAVDSIERALRLDPDGPASAGLRAVLEQMESILARYGVTRTGEVGEPFDPERHEAISVREGNEAPDRTVVDVARSGYSLGDRVLRPAQVVVSRAG
ncbi:MAG: molecular chaperone GrpE [Thermoleophilaceae bacterium]|jgi:molecular chaperone GrpE|nr:molecular chaperone GrpE [Thermoleophilaceae bacterium]